MTGDAVAAFSSFTRERKFNRKGPLSVALMLTEHARKIGLPLDPERLLTESGGQVFGLGKSESILQLHGIDRVCSRQRRAHQLRQHRQHARIRRALECASRHGTHRRVDVAPARKTADIQHAITRSIPMPDLRRRHLLSEQPTEEIGDEPICGRLLIGGRGRRSLVRGRG